MLGLDPSKQIVNLAVESGKSIWLRKNATGSITYKREFLDTDLIVFDEFQAADQQTKRHVSIFMDGRKTVNFENEQLTVHPAPILTINPNDATSLEDRLGLNAPQIRRSIVCDLSKVKVPELALKGEEIIATAKSQGALELRKPTLKCAEYKVEAYSLLKSCLNRQGLELVDFEMLLMLSHALTGYLQPVDAIRMVFYDALLLFETLGWTLPGWVNSVGAFPSEPDDLFASNSTDTKTIPQKPGPKCLNTWTKAAA